MSLLSVFRFYKENPFDNPPGVRTQDVAVKTPCLNLLTSGSFLWVNKDEKKNILFMYLLYLYPRNDLNVYDKNISEA
jgi:hypothetical protein